MPAVPVSVKNRRPLVAMGCLPYDDPRWRHGFVGRLLIPKGGTGMFVPPKIPNDITPFERCARHRRISFCNKKVGFGKLSSVNESAFCYHFDL